MSEEKLDHIASKLDKMDERLSNIEHSLATVTQNTNTMRENIYLFRQQDNSTDADVFSSLRRYMDDLKFDLSEMKHRRLHRRVM
jgi:uncharacterized protein YhaN